MKQLVIEWAKKSGMQPQSAPHDVNALGKHVPLRWLEKFAALAVQWGNTQHRGVFREVAYERSKQVHKGWTARHDDEHEAGEIVRGACAFAMASIDEQQAKQLWPTDWVELEFDTTRNRHNLIKAAAMLVAEIERLDRKSALELPMPIDAKEAFSEAYNRGGADYLAGRHLNYYDFFESPNEWRQWIAGYQAAQATKEFFEGDQRG